MARVLTAKSIGVQDFAQAMRRSIGEVRSDKDSNFTGIITKNSVEQENIPGLLSNKIRINQVGILSTQPLKYLVSFYSKDTFGDADLDIDSYIGSVFLDLPQLSKPAGISGVRESIYLERLYSGSEFATWQDMVMLPSGALLRCRNGASNVNPYWQWISNPGTGSDFATWKGGGTATFYAQYGLSCCKARRNSTNVALIMSDRRFSAENRTQVLSLPDVEPPVAAQIALLAASAATSTDTQHSIASDYEDNPAAVNSNCVYCWVRGTSGLIGRSYKPPTTLGSQGIATFTDLTTAYGISVIYSDGKFHVFFAGLSASGAYKVWRTFFDYDSSSFDTVATEVLSFPFSIRRINLAKLGSYYRLNIVVDGDYGIMSYVSSSLTGEWVPASDVGLQYEHGLSMDISGSTVWAATEDGVWRSSLHCMNVNDMNLLYRDDDLTKELHVELKNLSPSQKEASPVGQLVLSVGYELAG